MNNEFSSGELLNNINSLIESGFRYPDKDGFKTTLERDKALTNNSFSEDDLRRTLIDINDHNTDQLKLANKDTVNFFKWSAPINDLDKYENEKYCEFRIPINQMIDVKNRNQFKWKQYFRKWVTIEDIYQDWDTFQFNILLFINNRIYTDYKFWIDDQEVLIHFRYYDSWTRENAIVSIYKFDTLFQKRILISRNQMENLWEWKIPVSEIKDNTILNYDHLVCTINRTDEYNNRKTIHDATELLGNNLEFVSIKDGFIDCTNFGFRNKEMIKSESKHWIWLSLFAPKNFHEYPIILPTDFIYQTAPTKFTKVYSIDSADNVFNVNDSVKNIYIDQNQNKIDPRWKFMIRPIVLSDAFIESNEDYIPNYTEILDLKDSTVKAADLIEEFRFYLKEDLIITSKFDEYIEKIKYALNKIQTDYKAFLKTFGATLDNEFEKQLKFVFTIISDLEVNRQYSTYLKNLKFKNIRFFEEVSPLIYIPRNLVDNFYNIEVIKSMKEQHIWEIPESYKNKIRFSRPVSENDIWIFEYNLDDKSWKPNLDIKVEYKYPDVYILSSKEKIAGKIFKAFIFYTDLLNVREELTEHRKSTPKWDIDLKQYELEKIGKFHDIFIEKFYWMSLKEVYSSILKTNYRWKIIEYVCDNDFYNSFNKLFLESIDPYFKISLLSYFKSEYFNFPTESAINDFNKALKLQMNSFNKITNYELYLDKNWRPSYFDFKTIINNQFNFDNHLKNDQYCFKFENIYDIDIQYEVFLNGKQITDFNIIHEDSENASKIDSININKSLIDNVYNSKFEIPAENYNIYKVDKINIIDSGTGYSVGQNVFIKTNNQLIKFEVTKISGLLKGIEELKLLKQDFTVDPSVSESYLLQDTFNNIDDEFGISYYENLTYPGITKPATFTYSINDYSFISQRFDNLINDNRNENFMHQDKIISESYPLNGDPEFNWYLGSRIDNQQINQYYINKWYGINPVNFVTSSFRDDFSRYYNSFKSDYQLFAVDHFYFNNEDQDFIKCDLILDSIDKLPKNTNEWIEAQVGKYVLILNDSNYNNKRMKYRVRGFYKNGDIVYNKPVKSSQENSMLEINWNNVNSYPDYPSMIDQYSLNDWETMEYYRRIEELISDHKAKQILKPKKELQSYISNLSIDDLCVYNCTLNRWEDLSSNSWVLNLTENGFILKYIAEGEFSYIFKFYFNRNASNQLRNASLIRDAKVSVDSEIVKTINKPQHFIDIDLNRDLMIRKIFPYEYRKEFELEFNKYYMEVMLPPYMHFRNQLYLEDIIIFNKTTGEFENILDESKFRVDFFNENALGTSVETQTIINKIILSNPGKNFVDGTVWGWNDFYNIFIFGEIKANINTGEIESFRLTYNGTLPKIKTTLQFDLYQDLNQLISDKGTLLIEIETKEINIIEDGFINGVSNPLAPLPEHFRVFVKYPLVKGNKYQYELRIEKYRKEFKLQSNQSQLFPEFNIFNSLNQDQCYILNSNGRIPLVNPVTKRPNFIIEKTSYGSKVKLMNAYQANEVLTLVSEPYSMRTVFSLRDIPSHGYINLAGKINKPLNKKYFEFWCNGRLLQDEVSIITPTKLVLHGLTSLRNFSIIEINRDPNEYFSNEFVSNIFDDHTYFKWNLDTYLDAALESRLDYNYSLDEQRSLLYPIYPQVSESDPNYKFYPINKNIESDILIQINADILNSEQIKILYNILILNTPTINGFNLNSKTLSFEQIGIRPITDIQIINELNDEWKEEIESDHYLGEHFIINDHEWYGVIGFGFNEYGEIVTNPDQIIYSILNKKIININDLNKKINII